MIDALIWFALGFIACAFAGATFSARVRTAVSDLWFRALGWFSRRPDEGER